jgi:tryptophanyl-tRNA synthetase
VDCKKIMGANLKEALKPMKEIRRELTSDLDRVKEIMAQGNERARKIARETMAEVREAVRI